MSQSLILWVVGLLATQASQCLNYFLLIDLQAVGDHTRGLFEAEASVAVSTAHTLQNVKVVFLRRHLWSRFEARKSLLSEL